MRGNIRKNYIINRKKKEVDIQMSSHFREWLSQNGYGTYNGIEITPESEIVAYTYVISIGVMSFKRSTPYYFKDVERDKIITAKILCILCNLLLGWWGIPWGPIWTVKETFCDLTNKYTRTCGEVAS